ncbi:hypothetical protein RHECNPAF_4300125 [Rhizobium etli CNPAF512]|nr:hypothetical protein RHECNPAF_4300125 [Rhizobium etli CNPAF512]
MITGTIFCVIGGFLEINGLFVAC